MSSKIKPAFRVVGAEESIEFEAEGAASWELIPPADAGILGATSGVYVAPPLITATQTAKVTAKDANGASLGEAILQLKLPDLEVVPRKIKLKAGQPVQFTIKPKVYAKEVTWTLQPGSPGRLTDNGAYTAPEQIAFDQQALVTVTWKNLHSSAEILLRTEKSARNILVGYWVLVVAGLSLSLFCLWPNICAATRDHRPLRVVPLLVTLKPGDAQQFHASLGGVTNQAQADVTWQASPPNISSDGLYTAGATNALITATSVRDPQLHAYASVNISTVAQFTIQPELVLLSEGQTVQFNHRLVLAGDPIGTNAAAATFLWSLSPEGAGTLTTNGFYQAPESIGKSRLVTVAARYDKDSRVAAAALVELTGPPPWCSDSMLLQLGLILTLGAVGSLIHAISSFVDYVGNRQFASSWFLWYIFKPFQGAALALVVYLIVAAGILKIESAGSLLGVAALAVMVGLFSDQASLKLRDVANALFGSREDKRHDKLNGSGQPSANAPHILSVTPNSIAHGPNLTPQLTISGSNFANGCLIRVNSKMERPPAATAPNELKLNLKSNDVANPGTILLLVVNPNKLESNEAKISVT